MCATLEINVKREETNPVVFPAWTPNGANWLIINPLLRPIFAQMERQMGFIDLQEKCRKRTLEQKNFVTVHC